jgi:hypothetical protein
MVPGHAAFTLRRLEVTRRQRSAEGASAEAANAHTRARWEVPISNDGPDCSSVQRGPDNPGATLLPALQDQVDAGAHLLVIASARWMIYDQDGSFLKKEKGGAVPAKQLAVKPIIATSHRHRIIRGGCKTSEGWRSLASFSGRYTPGMSAEFGRLIHNALCHVDRPTRYRPTTFSRDTTFKFVIAEVQAPPNNKKEHPEKNDHQCWQEIGKSIGFTRKL